MSNKSLIELRSTLKQLLQTALNSLIGSIIACSIFFLFLSMFIFNLDVQHYHFKDNRMIIDNQVQIIQALEPMELIDTYFNEN